MMTNSQVSNEIEQRVHRIENSLLPKTAFRGQVTKSSNIKERMADYRVPGVSIAVIHQDQIEWSRSYGVLESNGSAAVTEASLFQAASIGKPIAATAALRLFQEGQLDLDEDVSSYLVSWKVPANGSWQPRITLRQLLSHTAGLTVDSFPGYSQSCPIPSLLQILEGEEPANTPAIRAHLIPGTQHLYSGGGYCVLQQLLMDITGKPFPKLMQELVLEPIGMERSTYEQSLSEALMSSAAVGHRANGNPVAGKWHLYPEMAAAGLWTTPSDLARFAIEIQQTKAGKSDKVLSRSVVSQMLAAQDGDDIGMGIFLEGEGESARFKHSGFNEGFICNLIAYKDQGFGAVVMTNSDSGWNLIEEVFQAIAQEYSWPDYPHQASVVAEVDPRVYYDYKGTYELKPGIQLTVIKDENRLFLQPTNQAAMELYPKSETEYFTKVVDVEIEFIKSRDGRVKELILRQNLREMVARKIA